MIFNPSPYSKCLLILLASFLVMCVSSPISAATNITPDSTSTTITVVKDVVNILFFVVIGTLGVLSYLQARKTIFTPIKTETFKLQLKIFEDIFSYFDRHKKELFIDGFDYRKIIRINALLLFDEYAETFFKKEIVIDKDRRKQMMAEVPIGNMAFQHVDKLNNTSDGLKLDLGVKIDVDSKPEDRLTEWLKYEYVMIHFTVNFQNQMDQLDRFISSPLVPSKIRNLIRDFQVAAYRNIHAMAEVLTDAAKELPKRYPSPETFVKAETSWIWNMFNNKRIRLENISDKIYQEINEYLNIEKLLS